MRFLLPLLFITTLWGGEFQSLKKEIHGLSLAELQSVIEFLADDLLEGRAPGTRGGDLSEKYILSLFKFMGLDPGTPHGYLQPVALKGFTTHELSLMANDTPLHNRKDVVGTLTEEKNAYQLEGEAVFAGFGIQSEIWDWDDFKGAGLEGKILIVRVNDPGMFKENLFEGKVLTYFGRWIYKIEEAARQNAMGILLIHTDQSAGYNWKVVQNSWAGEEIFLDSDINNSIKFRGWIKESSLRKVLDRQGISLDRLYASSLRKAFKPKPLNFNIKIQGKNQIRSFFCNNVVAEIPGKSKEKIVLSAHIDHHGMKSERNGDLIFNGAIDNGSAVAAMLMVAKILKPFQKQLHYTVSFLACQAEESGLLGSKHYVLQEDRSKLVANINFESTPVWGKTTDFMGVGARFSTLEDMLKSVLEKEGLEYTTFSLVNQGFFYRSDQFSFARYGIPGIWISAGENDDSGLRKYPNFWLTDYHTVKDEYNPKWTLEGLRQTIKITLLLIAHMNETKAKPRWKGKLTFPLQK